MSDEDTIAAVATPPGAGGISVIRVSGAHAAEIAGGCFSSKKGKIADLPSHTVHLGEIRKKGEVLDQVLVTFFRAPHSYTGEDVIEISAHGGLIVTKEILDLLIRSGARHAEPGEFTKRAFLNGKIDLTQAEAVLDLIKAKSEKSLETAARQLAGSLSARFKTMKDELVKILAHMEADLDFPEEHLEVFSEKELMGRIEKIEREIEELIASFERGSCLREGITAVIVGKPNVGKSSLFNALLARDRALVSEIPGTTRDPLEEAVEIGGIFIRLIDTAGIARDLRHPLDRLGVERAREMVRQADLFLYVVDGSKPLDKRDEMVFREMQKANRRPVLTVVNKSDLGRRFNPQRLKRWTGTDCAISVSSKTRQGLDALEKAIRDSLPQAPKEGEQITRLRHKNALERSLASLKRMKGVFPEKRSLELVTLDLHEALEALRELIGEVYSEDLLDVIFAEFCIGK